MMTDLEDLLPAALDRLGSDAEHANRLAADVRQAARRRRLMVAGPIAAVLAVCAVVAVVWTAVAGSSPTPVTGGVAPASTSACSALQTGPLPMWARAGFSGDGSGVHWTLSTSGNVAAIVFGYPLVAPHAPQGRNNKILWVVKDTSGTVTTTDAVPIGPVTADQNLRIVGHLEGTDVTTAVDTGGAPGPSIVDMPQAGCWHLDLSWGARTDSIDLAWLADK